MRPELREVEAFRALSAEEMTHRKLAPWEDGDVAFLCEVIDAGDWQYETKAFESHLSQEQQVAVAEVLLELYGSQDDATKLQIVQAITRAIRGYWCGFERFVRLLLPAASWPGTHDVVVEASRRIRFARDLLDEMSARRKFQVPWIQRIRAVVDARDFIDEPVYHEEALGELLPALQRAEAAVRVRQRSCSVCGELPESMGSGHTQHESTLPGDIANIRVIRDGDYRDSSGDLCQRTETLCRCDECGQSFRHVLDTDMQVLGWSTYEWLYPLTPDELAKLEE